MNTKRYAENQENKADIIKHIYIFRHGETNFNIEKRITGYLENEPIFFTENGANQIKQLAKFIHDVGIDAIFASDLMRAQDTALMINEGLNIPISFHKELRGISMGKYQGLRFEDAIKDKDVFEAFKDHDKLTPGGESINQFISRLLSFINKIVFEYPYENISIIAHNAVVGNLKAAISGNTYADADKCVLLYKNGTFKVIESGLCGNFSSHVE